MVHPGASLGEKLQQLLADANVVKTMNTAAGKVFIHLSSIGPSSVFVSGSDANAKTKTKQLLKGMGWPEESIVDLGGHLDRQWS